MDRAKLQADRKRRRELMNQCFKCGRNKREIPCEVRRFQFGARMGAIVVCLECTLGPEVMEHPAITALIDASAQKRQSQADRKARRDAAKGHRTQPQAYERPRPPVAPLPETRPEESSGSVKVSEIVTETGVHQAKVMACAAELNIAVVNGEVSGSDAGRIYEELEAPA